MYFSILYANSYNKYNIFNRLHSAINSNSFHFNNNQIKVPTFLEKLNFIMMRHI